MSTISVGGEYDVVIGHGVLERAADLVPARAEQVLLVTTPGVQRYASTVRDALERKGIRVTVAEVPDAEAAKSADVLVRLWSVLGQAGFTRSDAVVAVGGGTVTDLGGFVAASWLRGVPVVQVPTTLLAMVDAAVGGKTGINTPEGKNLVGAFHPPVGVVCDLDVLATLPPADLTAGLAEAVKCGFLDDPRILELAADPAPLHDPSSPQLAEVVERAIATKARVVAADLRESSLREILNYGHTLAHAIEHREHYAMRHGDAVAIGMVYAAQLGHLAGHLSAADVDTHRRLIAGLGLPTRYDGPFDELLAAMRRDKKSRGSLLRFVVLDGIGRPTRLEGPSEELLREAYVAVTA